MSSVARVIQTLHVSTEGVKISLKISFPVYFCDSYRVSTSIGKAGQGPAIEEGNQQWI